MTETRIVLPTSAPTSNGKGHDTNTVFGALRFAKDLKANGQTDEDKVKEGISDSAPEKQRVPTSMPKDPNLFLGSTHISFFKTKEFELDVRAEVKEYNNQTTAKEKAEVLLNVVNKLCFKLDENINEISGPTGKKEKIKGQELLLNLTSRIYEEAAQLHDIKDEKYKLDKDFCPLTHILHVSSEAIKTIVKKGQFGELYYDTYEEFYHLLAQKCITENLSRVPSQNVSLIHTSTFIDVHERLLESKTLTDVLSVEGPLGEFISTEQTFLKSFKDIFVASEDKKEASIEVYLQGVPVAEKDKLQPYLALYKKFISEHPLNQLKPQNSYSLRELLTAFTATESVAHLVWLAHAMMMQRIIQDQGLFDHLGGEAKRALNNIAIMPPQRNPRYKMLLEAMHKHAGDSEYRGILTQLINAVDALVLSANTGLKYIEASLKVMQGVKKISPDKFKVLSQQFDRDVKTKLELGDAKSPGRIITLLEYAKDTERSKRAEAQLAALQAQISELQTSIEIANAAAKAREEELNAAIRAKTEENDRLRNEAAEAKAAEAKANDVAEALVRADTEKAAIQSSGLAGAIVSTMWGTRNLSEYQTLTNKLDTVNKELDSLSKVKDRQDKEVADLKKQLADLGTVKEDFEKLKVRIDKKDEQVARALEEAAMEIQAAGKLRTENDALAQRIAELKKQVDERNNAAESQLKPALQTQSTSVLSSFTSLFSSSPTPLLEEKSVHEREGKLREEYEAKLETQRQQLEKEIRDKEDELKAAVNKSLTQAADLKQREGELAQYKLTSGTQVATIASTQAQVATLSAEKTALQTQVADLSPKSWGPWAGGGMFAGLGGAFSGAASGVGFAGIGTFAALGIGPPGWIALAVILLAASVYCIYKAVENYRILHPQPAAGAGAEGAAVVTVAPSNSGTGSGLTNNATLNATFPATPSASMATASAATRATAETNESESATSSPASSVSVSQNPAPPEDQNRTRAP